MQYQAQKFKCNYSDECADKEYSKCSVCRNNTLRNALAHYFEQANDKPLPDPNPRVSYNGPAEQTQGYKCPVCGGYTNPYAMKDRRCINCGWELNCS